jgi:pimeloyl-ACP methyl ester carboxylesterase
MKKFLIVLVVLTIAVIVGGTVYESKMEVKDAQAYPAAGKLVDVNGRKLHVVCAGQGGPPTVIFESSGLSSSAAWEKLLPEVGRAHHACAYDRAGMGWSDPVAGERTTAEFVDELRAALASVGEKPPYVLVGHSIGGVLVRAFQAAHPDEVTGMVLVDTATASVQQRWPKVVDKMQSNVRRGRWLASVAALRLVDPLHVSGRDAALTYRPRTMIAAGQVIAAARVTLPTLSPTLPVPTVVLTHGHGGDWAGPGVIGPLDEAAIEYDWQGAQKELAKGPKPSLVVADKSGHMINADQPELILQAIETVTKP